ncbi:hypothetical protein M0R45_009383 [Rubus argutus]|uniref:Uncharacterized protein n=1 Tax=Rubus argutus TaxID=59490 RepID=A0AAW1Y7R1_RUBAR
MNIVPIRDLEPRQSGIKIRVRVCRIWRPKIVKSDGKFDGLHCIVVDAMGDAIEASVQEVDYDLVAPKIEAGCLYDITRFNTGIGKSSYQIVPHCAQLKFNARTIFSKLSNVHPVIQRHRFYLLDYNSLSSRIDDVSILTDVLGHICAIQPLQDKILNDSRIEKMCEIYIENLRKKEIKVTLWGDTAASFNFKALEESTTATFVVFTSLKVKDYNGDPVLNSTLSTLTFINPDILELQAYKSMFSDSTNIVRKLPFQQLSK